MTSTIVLIPFQTKLPRWAIATTKEFIQLGPRENLKGKEKKRAFSEILLWLAFSDLFKLARDIRFQTFVIMI